MAASRSGISCNAKRISLNMRRVSKQMPVAMGQATLDNGDRVLELVRRWSSLTDHSLSDLRKMGHPYAAKHPFPPHPRYMIHTQGGRFLRNWRLAKSLNADGATITIHNTTPYARYLEKGTRNKMIARPILREALKVLRASMNKAYKDMMAATLKGARAATPRAARGGSGGGAARHRRSRSVRANLAAVDKRLGKGIGRRAGAGTLPAALKAAKQVVSTINRETRRTARRAAREARNSGL